MSTFRKNLIKDQTEKLQKLLSQVQSTNPFYQNLYKDLCGVDQTEWSLDSFSDLIPFTTKLLISEDQKQNPPFGTNLSYPIGNYTRFHQTSGSTGTPIRWLDTNEDWQSMLESWKRVFIAAGCQNGERVYFAFSFGPFLGFWTAFEAGQQLDMLCIPGGGLSTAGRLKAILSNDVTVLCCTPTYAIHLGESAIKEGIDLTKCHLKKIIVAGEPGGSIPSIRENIERIWPTAKVFDHHGMTEVGPVTFPCPRVENVLRVYEDNFIAEVIHPETLKSVVPGESGELVLTTLTRIGSPLIRYRTGDLVQTLSKEEYEKDYLGLKRGIIGRADDMVIVRGVNIFPSAIDAILRKFDGIAEYQVLIDEESTMTQIHVDVELKPHVVPQTYRHNIEQALKEHFNLRIPVIVVPYESLPRFEMKAKRWIRQ